MLDLVPGCITAIGERERRIYFLRSVNITQGRMSAGPGRRPIPGSPRRSPSLPGAAARARHRVPLSIWVSSRHAIPAGRLRIGGPTGPHVIRHLIYPSRPSIRAGFILNPSGSPMAKCRREPPYRRVRSRSSARSWAFSAKLLALTKSRAEMASLALPIKLRMVA